MLYNIIILESSLFFYCDHMTLTVSCDICDTSYDCNIILNSNPRSLSIENKSGNKIEINKVYYLQLWQVIGRVGSQ